jgi:hypothetical protein
VDVRCWFGGVQKNLVWVSATQEPVLEIVQIFRQKNGTGPPNNPGSTAYGVHRTEPNVLEDLLMDLKCQDSRESWNNERIPERLPISRSLKDTYPNSKLSHISVFCVVKGQLHLCRQMQEGPLRVLD